MIGDGIFSGCTSLKTVIIPDTVIAVQDTAFNGCTLLVEILYCGTEQQWKAANLSGYTAFKGLTIYFYSEQEKYDGKAYWHYDEQGKPVKW